MKHAKINSYFGKWVVSTGETLFPKMFKTKQPTQETNFIKKLLTD